MNAMFEHVGIGVQNSVKAKIYQIKEFDVPYHFHPEYEITWIIRSTGNIYLNDSVCRFEPGDIFIFGPNVPHVFINDPDSDEVEVLVVQFSSVFIEGFNTLVEFNQITSFLTHSDNGIKIENQKQDVYDHLIKVHKADGLGKILGLIQFLEEVSWNIHVCEIDAQSNNNGMLKGIPERLLNVLKYIADNYHKDIPLEEIASVANMNKSAFCRDFKKHTRRTYIEYINDLRIEYACKLLLQGTLSMSDIGYEVGFNSISYFNRIFKIKKGIIPSEYKRLHANQ